MAKKQSRNSNSQTLFDVPAVKRESVIPQKKNSSSISFVETSRIGLNAAYEKDGHALKNRNNSI